MARVISLQDVSKKRCKKPRKTISSPIGATITTVKNTKIREKGFSGDKRESRFRKESGRGNIESIIIFNSLEIKTTPNESAKE